MDYQAAAETFQRALAHHKAGTVAEAMAAYQEILELFSGEPDLNANLLLANAHNNLGVLMKGENEFREALGQFREALDLAPGHVDAMANLGIVYLSQGNAEGALDLFKEALELHPEHDAVRDGASRVYRLIDGRVPDHLDGVEGPLRLDDSRC